MAKRTSRIAKALAVSAVLVLAPALPAFAQFSSNWKGCTGNPDVDWERQITACTALIDGGGETKENMGIAYYNRALAYENLDKFNEAIADFTRAIALNPEDADSYLYRGIDKTRLGDKAGGEADIETAKRINPNIGR
jgi:tetratricopeptide (TPR) repeat protein